MIELTISTKKLKLIFYLFIFAFLSFALVTQAKAATTTTYTSGFYTTQPAYSTPCRNSSGCTSQVPECWNSERYGVTDCGLACGGGNPWTKYNRTGCFQTTYNQVTDRENCEAIYVETTAVCSTADKYDSNDPPVMKWGSCNCGVGGQYKTCCSGTNLVNAVPTPIDKNEPPEAYCPSGSSVVYCGQAGQPACGQDACGYAAPTPTNAPVPTVTPTPAMNSGCSGYTCTYSEVDGKCYGGTGGSGFNPGSGCSYLCGPVACPSSGGGNPTPTNPPVANSCQIIWWDKPTNPNPNQSVYVKIQGANDWSNWNRPGFKVDGEWLYGVTVDQLPPNPILSKYINSKYPGNHTIELFTGCSSDLTGCVRCTPSTTFTTVSDVTAPSPTPLPPKCINGSLTDTTGSSSVMKIAWTNPGSHPITWVDIKPNAPFAPGDNGNFYNKQVTGTSTTVPYDFKLYTYNSATNTSSRTTPLTLYPNTTYYVRLFNDYAQGPSSPFSIPSCTTLSGRLIDNSPTNPASLFGKVINSKEWMANGCIIGSATTDASGLYVFPNIPVSQNFCLYPPAITGYTDPAPTLYSWQIAGYTKTQSCSAYGGSYCTDDRDTDNAYNFTYTPISTPTATSTPKPLPAWIKTSGGDVHENR